MRHVLFAIAILVCLTMAGIASSAVADERPRQSVATTVSGLDGEQQSLKFWAPEDADKTPTPLFVFLHSWSSDYQQDNSKWLVECVRRNWIWIHPDFRGINESPKACGSKFARHDILEAIRFAREKWNVDSERVYLAGVSGGGHMSLLMAGHHPEQFSAVSSWVGPNDLIEWHRFHTKNGQPEKYAKMIEASLGGPPGTSSQIDADYRDRSPVFHLQNAKGVPISIWAGVEDGHTGSVPVSHSLRAFNVLAETQGDLPVSDLEIMQLSLHKRLKAPQASDRVENVVLGRKIYLHRTSGRSVVTIFEGGHESIPEAAFEWLERQQKMTAGQQP